MRGVRVGSVHRCECHRAAIARLVNQKLEQGWCKGGACAVLFEREMKLEKVDAVDVRQSLEETLEWSAWWAWLGASMRMSSTSNQTCESNTWTGGWKGGAS